jgi:hypothetical protein
VNPSARVLRASRLKSFTPAAPDMETLMIRTSRAQAAILALRLPLPAEKRLRALLKNHNAL